MAVNTVNMTIPNGQQALAAQLNPQLHRRERGAPQEQMPMDALIAALGGLPRQDRRTRFPTPPNAPSAAPGGGTGAPILDPAQAAFVRNNPQPGGYGADVEAATSQPSGASASAQGNAAYRDAIAGIESGGRYDIVGPTHPKLGRALGKYQVMEANVGPWSRQALGREITAEEFLANPEFQDAIFDHVFGGYVQKFGPEGAAQAWFAGPGGVGKMNRQDSLGTSVAAYTDKFRNSLGAVPPATTGSPFAQSPQQGPTPTGRPTQQNGGNPALLAQAIIQGGNIPAEFTQPPHMRPRLEPSINRDMQRRTVNENLDRGPMPYAPPQNPRELMEPLGPRLQSMQPPRDFLGDGVNRMTPDQARSVMGATVPRLSPMSGIDPESMMHLMSGGTMEQNGGIPATIERQGGRRMSPITNNRSQGMLSGGLLSRLFAGG